MDMLILRLRGPLMSFGDVAVDETRPTDTLPTLSQITGMIANALGWDFRDTAMTQRLQDRLMIASRAEQLGTVLQDYQTAAISTQTPLWRTDGLIAERTCGGEKEQTVQMFKYYRSGAGVTVLLALKNPEEYPTLTDIKSALKTPFRPIFIGRMSCPPSCPICCEPEGHEIVSYESLEQGILEIPLFKAAIGKATSDDVVLIEWPLMPSDVSRLSPEEKLHVVERFDCRDWDANVISGSRLVYRAMRKLKIPEAEVNNSNDS